MGTCVYMYTAIQHIQQTMHMHYMCVSVCLCTHTYTYMPQCTCTSSMCTHTYLHTCAHPETPHTHVLTAQPVPRSHQDSALAGACFLPDLGQAGQGW